MDYEVIYHHGVKGMKWGIRRYQRKDGSLTPAGKKRYNLDKDGNLVKKKSLSEMSDKEINEAIARKQLENRYTELYGQQENKRGNLAKTAKEVLGPAAINAGKTLANGLLDNMAKTTLKKLGLATESEYDRLKKEHDILDMKSKINKLKNPDSESEYNKLKKEHDILDMKSKIDKLKNPDSDDMSALEKAAKKAGYEKTIAEAEMTTRRNEKQKQDDKAAADKKAADDKAAADKAARDENASRWQNASYWQGEYSNSYKKANSTPALPAPKTSNSTVNKGYETVVDMFDRFGGTVIGQTTYTEK